MTFGQCSFSHTHFIHCVFFFVMFDLLCVNIIYVTFTVVPVQLARRRTRSMTALHFILAICFNLAIRSLYVAFENTSYPRQLYFAFATFFFAYEYKSTLCNTYHASGCITSHRPMTPHVNYVNIFHFVSLFYVRSTAVLSCKD